MKLHKRMKLHKWLIIMAALLPGLLTGQELSDSGAVSFDSVLQAVALAPPAQARYTELRVNPMFDRPMEVSGTVEILGGGCFRKTVDSPYNEEMAFDGKTLSIERNGETRTLPARSARSVRFIFDAITATLSGDTAELRKQFDIDLHGTATEWQVTLVPKQKRIQRQLQRIELGGDDRHLVSLAIIIAEDQSTTMHFHHEVSGQP